MKNKMLTKSLFFSITLCSLLSFSSIAKGYGQKPCPDLDLDGYGTVVSKACKYVGIDCNDNNKDVHPNAIEACNGLDDNCNGVIDEGCCSANTGSACSVGVGQCKQVGSILCNGVCSAVASSPTPEVCGDGLDNDCDSIIDNGCQPSVPLKIGRLFKGSYDRTTQTSFVANKNKAIILVESGASRTVDLKNVNPNIKILRYTKFAGTHSPVTRPTSGDYFWSLANGTPNLIWYGPSGNPMKQAQFGWYFIDIMHNDMSSWALKQRDYQSSDTGLYDGEFLDSAGPQTPDLVSEYPLNYSSVSISDPTFNNDYSNAAINLMAKIRLANPNSILIPNGYAGWMPDGFRGMGFLNNSSGIMFEGYAFKVSGKYFDVTRYAQNINDFCKATKDGQMSVAVDYLKSDTDSTRMFAFATYLLSVGRNSLIYTISPKGDVAYFPEDQIDLGSSVPPCPSVMQPGVFTRSFDNNVVVITNVSGSDKTIDLNRPIQKLVINGDTTWNGSGSINWVSANSVILLKNNEGIILK